MIHKWAYGALLFAAFILWADVCPALTVNADVAADTTWTAADSPVTVTDTDFRVSLGATLTIDPGVTVKFAGSLTVYGVLDAEGTSVNPIVFDEVNPGDKWGLFKISRAACGDAHNLSTLTYVNLNNMESYIYLDRQSLTIQDSTITMSGSMRYGIQGYNNNAAVCPGSSLMFTFVNNTFNFTTSYASGLNGGGALHLDGVNALINANTFNATFTGAIYQARGVNLTISNTDDFFAGFESNTLNIESQSDDTEFTYGLFIDSSAITSVIDTNVFDILAHNEITGIKATSHSAVANDITLESTSATSNSINRDVTGIEVTDTSGASEIRENKITLTSDIERYLVGIRCQNGAIVNNRILMDITHNAGKAFGISHDYYPGYFENNTIAMSAGSVGTHRGVYLGTRYSSSDTVIRNNIFYGSDAAGSTAIYKDSYYAGTVSNSYNLYDGFDANYSGDGVIRGPGEFDADPLFDDPAELTLLSASPALDKGDWSSPFADEPAPNGGRVDLGAYGNTAGTEPTVNLVAPEIATNDGGDFATNATSVTLSGSTSTATNSLWVNGATAGVTHTPGQVAWSYTTVLSEGSNAFSVVAKNSGGQASASETVTVFRNDITPPEIDAITPEDGDTGVPVDTDINATFSEALDGATLTAANFTLDNGVSGDVSYAHPTAEFVPSAPLAYATTYTVTLSANIRDTSGNPLGTDFSWSFTTESAPAATQSGTQESPDDNATTSNVETDDDSETEEPAAADDDSGTQEGNGSDAETAAALPAGCSLSASPASEGKSAAPLLFSMTALGLSLLFLLRGGLGFGGSARLGRFFRRG